MTTYIIYWSRGPMDNPDDGKLEVEAYSVLDAIQVAETKHGLYHRDIDAIVHKDVEQDLFPS